MKIFTALLLMLTLTACGTSSVDPSASPTDSVSPSASFTPAEQSELVPTNCEDSGVKEFLADEFDVEGLEYVAPPAVPTVGTKLWDVLSNGGLSCAFANETGQGMRIDWVPNVNDIFTTVTSTYQEVEQVEIPGAETGKAIYLFISDTGNGQSGWSVSFVANGVWIEILTNIQDLDTLAKGQPIIDKAISVSG